MHLKANQQTATFENGGLHPKYFKKKQYENDFNYYLSRENAHYYALQQELTSFI
jgi:hypothetical protein